MKFLTAQSMAVVTLALALVINQINSSSVFSSIAAEGAKIGSAAVAAVAISLAGAQRRPAQEIRPLRIGVIMLVALYYVLLAVRTLLAGHSEQQGAILLQSIVLAGLVVLAHVARVDVLRAFWLTFAIQCALALISQDAVQNSLHGTTGGSHPSIVGFSAAMLIALTMEKRRRATPPLPRWVTLAAVALASSALLLSFNRTSLIGLAVGLVAYVAIKGRAAFVAAAALLLAIGLVAGVPVLSAGVALLSGGDPESFYTASGRLLIWERAVEASSSYLPYGLGLGANDASAEGSSLVFRATFGSPLENSFLQSAVWLGYAGLVALAGHVLYGSARAIREFKDVLARCVTVSVILTACMATSALAGTSLPTFFLISLALGMGSGVRTPRESPSPTHSDMQGSPTGGRVIRQLASVRARHS